MFDAALNNLPIWISVNDRLPEDSQKVLITDGTNVSCAHYFGLKDERHEAKNDGKAGDHWWANQFDRMTGGFVHEPTHWMPVAALLNLEMPT